MKTRIRAAWIGLLVLTAAGVAMAQDNAWQDRIRVTALTYDDGFGLGLRNPAAVWYDRNTAEVLVADAGNGRIVIYDSLLTALYTFRHYVTDPASGANVLGEPQALAANSSGEILVADGRTDRLDLLDFRGRVIAFGSRRPA
jgi:DNA-binding beta-propeller fold protein YncE